MPTVLDRNAVLHALRKNGTNLKKWCEVEGYGYRNASNVLRGISRAHFGQGKEIAEKLKAISNA
jgi:gp16 family phage-associated protein